jgi:hypothetical protein
MDSLTFVVEMTKALAWPLTAIGAVVLLRAALLELIPTLRKLKYRDLELEFGRQLDQVAAMAEEAQLPVQAVPPALPAPQPTRVPSDLQAVAEIAPRAAVLEAYRRVEQAADQALRRSGTEPPRSPRARRHVLESKGIVTSSTGALLEDLRSLRNLAAHADDFSLTPAQALEYAELSQRLAGAINVSSTGTDQ